MERMNKLNTTRVTYSVSHILKPKATMYITIKNLVYRIVDDPIYEDRCLIVALVTEQRVTRVIKDRHGAIYNSA